MTTEVATRRLIEALARVGHAAPMALEMFAQGVDEAARLAEDCDQSETAATFMALADLARVVEHDTQTGAPA